MSDAKGGRFHVDKCPKGGAISRIKGGRFHVDKCHYPQERSVQRGEKKGGRFHEVRRLGRLYREWEEES